MLDVAEVVAGNPVFAELDRGELERVATAFSEHYFPAASHIVREGDRGAGVLAFFVITEGRVVVTTGGTEVRRCGPGDHFGEIGLLDDVPRTATVTAETGVRCLGLSAWDFRTLVDEHPELGAKLTASAQARRSG